MKVVDLDSWPRRKHYEFFRAADYGFYNVCFDVEVGRFVRGLKAEGLPFYYAMIRAVTRAAEAVEEFRYRARGDEVVLHESLTPSFTDMDDGGELFKLVTAGAGGGIRDFCARAAAKSRAQTEPFPLAELAGRDDFLYITSLPWISFTHVSHTFSIRKDDSVPRLSWGRYRAEGDRLLLPYSCQVHHSFVDGIHVARHKEALEDYLADWKMDL